MAQKVTTVLVDDLDGTELAEGEGQTIAFAVNGQNYEIDLSEEHAAGFHAALAVYIEAARKAGKTPRPGKRSQVGPTTREIRDWARSNGYEVPDRGRIPAPIHEAFAAAT